jgi:GNAT superfamily N-acetyltransferase
MLELVAVATPEHWSQFHEIRRVVLFEARGRFGVYNENHPDDRLPRNHPLLLLVDGVGVAVVRVDLLPDSSTAGFRRLAVAQQSQRRGYGTALMKRAEAFAVSHGCTRFIADVAPDAVTFWRGIGYCLVGSVNAQGSPRMEKSVTK